MKKTEERIIAERVVESIRKKHYRSKNPKIYIKVLEDLLIKFTENLEIQKKSQIKGLEYYQKIGKALPSIGESCLYLFNTAIQTTLSSIDDKIKLKKLESDISKHRGKKVSPENKELYDLIEQKDNERKERGEDSNYKQSTKVAVREKYKSMIGWEKSYKNFIDYRNRPFRNKSVIRKLS